MIDIAVDILHDLSDGIAKSTSATPTGRVGERHRAHKVKVGIARRIANKNSAAIVMFMSITRLYTKNESGDMNERLEIVYYTSRLHSAMSCSIEI